MSSASFSGRPKFCSSNVLRNSGPTGSGISSATILRPVANAWPALSAREMRSSASGNASSNARIRRLRLHFSTMNGIAKPSAAADRNQPTVARTAIATMSADDARADRARSAARPLIARSSRRTARSSGPAPSLAWCRRACRRAPAAAPSCCALNSSIACGRRPSLGRCETSSSRDSSRRCTSSAGHFVHAEVGAEHDAGAEHERETTRMNGAITAPPSRPRTCRAAGGCPTPSAARTPSAGRRSRGSGR